MAERAPRHYQFGPFELDTNRRLLRRDGEVVALTPKCFDILLALIKSSGEIISKDELMQRVWPDSYVEDGNLTYNISVLRKALGERAGEHHYIVTIPGRGYQFVAEVKAVGQIEPPTVEVIEESDSPAIAQAAEQAPARAPQPEVKWNPRAAAFTAFALLAVLGITLSTVWVSHKREEAKARAAAQSIAVLPFKTLTGEGDDAYLGIGLADALITRLGRMSQIIVRPTSAVRKYTREDTNSILAGRELQVQSVLEGSIQKDGERLRLTVQLIHVEDGQQLWTEQFDENVAGLLQMEDRLSERVASVLALKLSGGERERLARHDTDNAEAHQLYLKGRYHWNRRTAEGLKKASDYFQQALALDPTYALAYAGLSDAYSQMPAYSRTPAREVGPLAEAAARRALEIDDTLAEAHTSLASALEYFAWDRATADVHYRRAIELNPNLAIAHHRYGVHLATLGRVDEALNEMQQAMRLDPLSPIIASITASFLYIARRDDEAMRLAQKTLEMDAGFGPAHFYLALVYERAGRDEEAFDEYLRWRALKGDNAAQLAEFTRAYHVAGLLGFRRKRLELMTEQAQREYVPRIEFADLYLRIGDKEQALAWLEKAYQEHEGELIWLKVHPSYDRLRDDPRFQDLLRRIGFTQ